MVEQLICNQQVGGSSPSTGSRQALEQTNEYGGVPEWPKGTDCKSAGYAFGGSNPPSPTKKKRQFSTEDCRFFLFFSLFSFRSSLFSKIVVSREKIREKREEKR